MNISSESSFNGTEAKTDFEMSSVVYIISILMCFPPSSYVIWLILRGTGNGLAAEFFILNISVCEILFCLETLLILLINKFESILTGLGFLDGVLVIGHPLFECLICVERYLAVVHPVTFLKYKPLRYRLMCSAVVWLAAFAYGGFSVIIWLVSFGLCYIVWLVSLFVFLSIQLYCCLAVLRALKQSGPGERGEENHMKRRAFYLILITTVTTFIIYSPYSIFICLPATSNNDIYLCVAQFCFILAGLVQPVLFLYRVGKLNFINCQ